MKSKLCFVVSDPMTVNSFLFEPIKRLSSLYDIYIIMNVEPNLTLGYLDEIVTVVPVTIQRKIAVLSDFLALLHLFKVFRQYRFDVVHSVTPKAGLLGMLAAYFSGVKVRLHTFTGQIWATKTGIARTSLKSFDKLIASFSTHILVDSPSQRQFLLDEGVVKPEKSSVLLKGSISGVDLSRFKLNSDTRARIRQAYSISDDDVVFLFIGRLNRDKGIMDLAKAFSIIARQHKQARLLIVGVDEANLIDEIKFILSDTENQVDFIDFTPVPEAYMSASDVLCLPSYREGFGNVIIEAAAVGIPTIGSKIYGITDAVVDGETGLLFVPKNIAEIVACLETTLVNQKLRIDLGVAAHARARDFFSSQKLSEAWLRYYRELS